MTRLLILSSNTGEGHNSVAAAIQSAAQVAGIEARIRKPLEESTRALRLLASLYNVLLTHRPQWMGLYFRFIERLRPNERDFLYKSLRDYIARFIHKEKPDTVLSVHPMLNHFIPRFIKEEKLEIPNLVFLTDPFPPFWRGWASSYVDHYLVPTAHAHQALIAAGIPESRVERVAMPVRPQFVPATMTEIQTLRNELELDGASIILINGGARGGGPLVRIYDSVRSAAGTANLLVVCGSNSRVRRRIESRHDPKTRTFGFLKDIHRYVAAADLIVTKPGSLSTFEALACRVPVVLTNLSCLMPQESGLFEAARCSDFGFGAQTFGELEDIVRQGPSEWNRKRELICGFYTPPNPTALIERLQPLNARI